jgi:16S rRNA processing protein RimM
LTERKKLLPILKVVSTHGLKGEVKALPLTTNDELILKAKRFYLRSFSQDPLEVESIRPGPGERVFLLKFKNVDFESAQGLIKSTLYLPVEELPTSSEDEVYIYELEGLKVEDSEGRAWGVISEVMPLGEYSLLRVESEEFDFYIPLVSEYVEEIDLENRKIVVKDVSALAELGKK